MVVSVYYLNSQFLYTCLCLMQYFIVEAIMYIFKVD